MFSNLNNTPNQTQGFGNTNFNKTSPFSFGGQKTPQANTSLFQSPNANSFNNQPTTPLFQNTLSKPSFQNTSSFATNTLQTNSFGIQKTSPFSSASISTAIPLPAPTNLYQSQLQTSQPFSTLTSSGFGVQTNFGFGQQKQNNVSTSSSIFGSGLAQNYGGNTASSASNFSSGTFGQSGFTSGLINTSQIGSQNILGLNNTTGMNPLSGFGNSVSSAPQTNQFGLASFGVQNQTPNAFGSGFGSNSQAISSQPLLTGLQQFGNSSVAQNSNIGMRSGLNTGLNSGFNTGFGGNTLGGSFGQSNQPVNSSLSQLNFGSQTSSGFGSISQTTGSNIFGGTSNNSSVFPNSISAPNFAQTSIYSSNYTSSQPSGFGSIFNAPSSSSSQIGGFPQSSIFQSSGQPLQSIGSSMPFSNQPVFSSLNPNFSSFGSNIAQSSQSQPSSNLIGGGLPISFNNMSTGSLNQISQPSVSFLNPVVQTVTFPGIPNISTVINQETDKIVEIFGYKGASFRFGPPEYYNSSYSSNPEQQTVSEYGLTTASKNTPFEHESISNSLYDYDLKLGNVLNANNDIELREVPFDTITRLRFSRTQADLLACASWDGSVSIFKIDDNLNQHLGSKININGCIFDLDWIPGSNSMVMGSSSGIIYNYDVVTNSCQEFSRHNGPVKAVKSCGDYNTNMIISGSYDGTVKMWDLRSKICLATINAAAKVYDMDVCKSGLAFITNEREICVYRFNDSNRHVFRKKVETSPFPLRCISMTTFNCRKEGGFVCAVGTCGGKVVIFAQSNNAKEFTFKANRIMHPTRLNSQIACPVHNIEFHPKTYVLGLGGGDGTVSFWDIQKHSQVHMLNMSSLPVTAISFHSSGRYLAYAVGYDWSRGIRGYKYKNMRPSIFIRRCNEEMRYACPNPVHNYSL